MEMDYGEDVESEASNDGSEDDILEDLEVERKNKRSHFNEDVDDEEANEDCSTDGNKRLKFTSEEELKRLSKPATAEELNRLRETENLFHSNLFRLQIEEMLKEVALKKKYKTDFHKWMEKFHSSIMKLEDSDVKYGLSDFQRLKSSKVKIPLPRLPKFEKGTYQFRKPLSVEVIGSYELETVVGPKVSVDVIARLPHRFYFKEDFSNCCYHVKRAFYLCDLVCHLEKLNDIVGSVNFVSDEIDVLKPKIEIIPSGKLGTHMTVILNVIPDRSGIDLSRFNPRNNNVKMKWFFPSDHITDAQNPDDSTPFYNSSILSDLTLKDNYEFVNDLLKSHKNIKDGIILLKIWLRQHELASGLGDFSGHVVSMLIAYLLQNRKLNVYMSSYQVVRTVFNYLISSDWANNGITLCNLKDNSIPTLAEFHACHQVVFIDTTGHYNICYGMHASTFLQIQHEAKIALAALDDPSVNSFQILFMTPVPFYRHFDHVVVFHNEEALENAVDIYSSREAKLNYAGAIYPQLVNMIYDVMRKGFRRRVTQFCARHPPKMRWKAGKKFRHSLTLTFGLNLDPENCFSVVDKAAADESVDFRQFWGERSELRRFQDGNITEAVVWTADLFSRKRLICKQIVTYLAKMKFGLNPSDFTYFADQFDQFISKSVEESAMRVVEVSGRLNKQLRSLKDLPLDIVSVQGASPVFRYTEISPMASAKCKGRRKFRDSANGEAKPRGNRCEIVQANGTVLTPDFIKPIILILHLGATNKWPHDLPAVDRLRAAFYIKIAQTLSSQCNVPTQVFPDRIELIVDGFVFHLKIFCPNEIGLLKQVTEDGLTKYKDNAMSTAVEKQMVLLPKLTSALHGLYEQHSSFGPACSIVKRWVNSQMMDPAHVSEEVLDMLVASLYLRPTPNDVPQQPQAAFLRFLHMMATMDWNSECIVLNINNELNREDILEIESHFTSNRDLLPPVFIATPYDRTKSLWTKDCPTPLILLRLVQLCGKAVDFVEKLMYKNVALDAEVNFLFEPSLDAYNAVIHLHADHNPKLKSLREDVEVDAAAKEIPVNGFDPAYLYVKELREAYDEVALFFYDDCGGSSVGVLWKPGITEPKDFKVGNMAMRTYDEAASKLILGKELIAEDFLVIGKGIVKSVDLKENGKLKTFTYL